MYRCDEAGQLRRAQTPKLENLKKCNLDMLTLALRCGRELGGLSAPGERAGGCGIFEPSCCILFTNDTVSFATTGGNDLSFSGGIRSQARPLAASGLPQPDMGAQAGNAGRCHNASRAETCMDIDWKYLEVYLTSICEVVQLYGRICIRCIFEVMSGTTWHVSSATVPVKGGAV